jgi:hypothetical protein
MRVRLREESPSSCQHPHTLPPPSPGLMAVLVFGNDFFKGISNFHLRCVTCFDQCESLTWSKSQNPSQGNQDCVLEREWLGENGVQLLVR